MFQFFDFSDPFGILPTLAFLAGAAICAGILYAIIAASMNSARHISRKKGTR